MLRIEPLLSARFIAVLRLLLASVCAVAAWASGSNVLPTLDVWRGFLAAYAIVACILLWVHFANWVLEFRLRKAVLAADLAIAILLGSIHTLDTDQFASISVTFFVFVLVEAIFLSGWRLAFDIGLLALIAIVIGALGLNYLGMPFDLSQLLWLVASCLTVMALTIWLGAARPVVPKLTSFELDLRSSDTRTMAEASQFAMECSGATTCDTLWRRTSETGSWQTARYAPADAPKKGEAVDRDATVLRPEPLLTRAGRLFGVTLDDGARQVVASRWSIPEPVGVPSGENILVVPLRTEQEEAVFILSGFPRVTCDLLWLGKAIERGITEGVERQDLLLGRVEDQLGILRQGVARDLHDSLAQSLANIAFRIEAAMRSVEADTRIANELHGIRDSLEREQRNVRDVIFRLRSGRPMPVRYDLIEELIVIADEMSAEWGIEIKMGKFEQPFTIGSSQMHEIGQILREAAANAVRHGGARTLQVDVALSRKSFHLDLLDDGTNRASEGPVIEPGSIGERVAALGGSLDTRRGPAGTRLYITVPRLSR